jgi:hypothetical protein
MRLRYCVFDLLYLDDKDLRKHPLIERKETLAVRELVWWLRTGTNRFTMQLATTRRWRMSTLCSARPYATYGTTFRKELRFRIPSQHSGK